MKGAHILYTPYFSHSLILVPLTCYKFGFLSLSLLKIIYIGKNKKADVLNDVFQSRRQGRGLPYRLSESEMNKYQK